MSRKICSRLQWCYPEELQDNNKWVELPLISSAEWDIEVEQEDAGHICDATVKASIKNDIENALIKNPYIPIILRGFTDTTILMLGSELIPVLIEFETDNLQVNFTFSCRFPA